MELLLVLRNARKNATEGAFGHELGKRDQSSRHDEEGDAFVEIFKGRFSD